MQPSIRTAVLAACITLGTQAGAAPLSIADKAALPWAAQ